MFQIKLLKWAFFSLIFLITSCDDITTTPGEDEDTPFISGYEPVKREYWIMTEINYKWDMVPSGESHMTNDVITPERRYLYKTIRYIQTDENWKKLPQPEWQMLSGPIIRATVGDSIIVNFKNDPKSGMPLSIHPHNVTYNEENEGIWRKDRPDDGPDAVTAGGAIDPGKEFTYRWKADEKSVGVGPYHSHSFSPSEEIALGLIGTIIVDHPSDHPDYIAYDTTIALVFKTYLAMVFPKDSIGDTTVNNDTCTSPLIPWNGGCHPKEHVPRDQWPENQVDSLARGGGPEVHTINGIAFANLTGLNFKKGQKARFVIFAMNEEGNQNHTAHFHGEMLQEVSRQNLFKDVFDLPSAVALELILNADNPGKWMLHCHVEHHAKEMMVMYSIQ